MDTTGTNKPANPPGPAAKPEPGVTAHPPAERKETDESPLVAMKPPPTGDQNDGPT